MITSAKTLFPNKNTFTCTGGLEFQHIFFGGTQVNPQHGNTGKDGIVITQGRYDGGLDQEVSSGEDEEWLEIECILKIESTGFTGGLDVGCEQKRGIKDDSQVFCLSN